MHEWRLVLAAWLYLASLNPEFRIAHPSL